MAFPTTPIRIADVDPACAVLFEYAFDLIKNGQEFVEVLAEVIFQSELAFNMVVS